MFNRSQKAYGGLNATKVNIGTFLGEDKAEDAFIVLSELPIDKSLKLRKVVPEGEESLVEFFSELLPSLLVQHNLHETETELMKKEDVVALIRGKTPLFLHVMNEYTNSLFPTPPSKSAEK